MLFKALLKTAALLFSSILYAETVDGDYTVTDDYVQQIDLTGIREVILQCYCTSRTIQTTARTENILELQINATLGSDGYHGTQNKPDKLGPHILSFVSNRKDSVLVLQSKENTIVHHFYIVNKLLVKLPPQLKLSIEPLSYAALDMRRVE